LDLRLREPFPFYKQIILTFNPDAEKGPWIKKMFFDNPRPEAYVDRSTIEDNPIQAVRIDYEKQLDALAAQDETYYKIYRWGEWAFAKGKIYNWDIVLALPDLRFDEIIYGGDFGYSIDPSVVLRIYRKADEFWIQELIYEKGLTNRMLGDRMKDEGVKPREAIYFDSSEPKSIQELFEMGFNVKPSLKGPDSVRAGIKFLQSKKIHILAGSENVIREVGKYKWREDKEGNLLSEPVTMDDHSPDAARYGIFTHCFSKPRAAAKVYHGNVYPE